MGCACSSTRTGSLSSTFLPQNQIMSPELREDIHEDLGVSLVACSLKGWRKTQEDTSAIVINLGGRKDMLGVGVFDGHSGQEASKYVAENMWNQVIATTEWGQGDIDGALRAAFLAVDANMQRDKVCHGTTAVVAVVTPGYLYVANCGDSRAVLCKEGVATAMSTDHKPCVYTERSRVIRCGGQVIPGEFGGVSRVTAPGSMVAMATSRSLGDFHFKRNYSSDQSEQVVSPAAEVVCVRRALGDEFLILGTDGVWDVLSNQEVSDMMRASNRTRIPRVPSPPPPPSVVWENSSAQASAAAAAAAAQNARKDAAGGGGRAGEASRESGVGAPQSLGATRSQNAAGVPNGTPAGATNGFLPAAVPATPYQPPATPHSLQQTTPFGPHAAASATAAAAAGAGGDPYDSSDFGSSDAGDGAVDPSQVGMNIDGESGGGRRPGDDFPASSAATGSKRPPAFIRLITPTLLRLVTPTPPNPANGPPRGAGGAASPPLEATTAKEEVAGGGKGRNSPPPVAVGGAVPVVAEGASATAAVGDGARAEVKPGNDSGKGGGSVENGPSIAGQGGSSGVMKDLVCSCAEETGAESESVATMTTGGGTPAATVPAAPASGASASEISAAAAAAGGAAGGANSSVQVEGTELASVAEARPPASDDKPACPAVGVDEAGVPPGRTCSSDASSKVSSGKEGVLHAGAAQSAPHDEPTAGEKKRDQALRLPVGEPGSLSSPSSSSSVTAGEPSPSATGPTGKGKDGAAVGEGLEREQGVAGDKQLGGGEPDGGGAGSWSTTTPPRPPVSLPRRGGGEGASTRASSTAPEASGVGSTSSTSSTSTSSVVDDSVGAPAAPTASVATNPAASGHHGDDDDGTTSRTMTPGTGAGSVVTPNPGATRPSGSSDGGGGGVTPSARTPGASSGGGGVSTAGTTPASARTPGGGAFSVGGSSSGGTWTSGGVGQTPSRQPSTSRGATPSRISSYRRSSGSGINLGLFKGSSSLSVSLSGKGDRSAIGAVQGVLDQALLKGSQDNMTLIAVDLRGFLESSSPDSDSAMS